MKFTPISIDEQGNETKQPSRFIPIEDVAELYAFGSLKTKLLCNSLIMSRYKIENKKRVTNWLLLKFPGLP